MLSLDPILDAHLTAGTKGVPPSGEGVAIRDVAAQGWNLLDGSIPMPAAVLRAGALHDNLTAFQAYIPPEITIVLSRKASILRTA
ncbi:MAG: hypothetical protein WDN06_02835 [Asticcacaulis sp.]